MTAVPAAGIHGGDGARVAAALGLDPHRMLDLSASLNPLIGGEVRAIVASHVEGIGSYPDVLPATSTLAEAMGVGVDRLLLTNGGAEAIAMLAREFGGHVEEPEFSLHPRHVDRRGPLWRSNPNNPTGRLAGAGERADVWDEAFYPLATGRWTRGDAGATVVGSLTKLFACPGLRIGYVLGDPGLVDRVRQLQPGWSVNGLVVAALADMLALADLSGWARRISELRAQMTDLLARFGLDPQASDANFVLCRQAPGLRDALAPHGVLVRDCASFGLADHARLAVPNADGLERLAGALSRALS